MNHTRRLFVGDDLIVYGAHPRPCDVTTAIHAADAFTRTAASGQTNLLDLAVAARALRTTTTTS